MYAQKYIKANIFRASTFIHKDCRIDRNMLNVTKLLCFMLRQSNPCTAPEGSRSLNLLDCKTIGTLIWHGCQPYVPAVFTPQKIFLVLIYVGGWVYPKTTPLGIENATFRLAARCFNKLRHCWLVYACSNHKWKLYLRSKSQILIDLSCDHELFLKFSRQSAAFQYRQRDSLWLLKLALESTMRLPEVREFC
jgi:hypothetical protein